MKKSLLVAISLALVIPCVVLSFNGCAEGPLWRTGYLSPWARQRWSDEERLAQTTIAKTAQMREMAEAAGNADLNRQEQVSEYLADVIQKDPIVLMRIEATELAADFNTEAATRALQLASQDAEADVRLMAVESWRRRGDSVALQQLGSMLNNDNDLDVRLRVTAALGSFSGPQSASLLRGPLTDPDPAMQIRAAHSLAKVTGEDFGTDIQAWRQYVDDNFGSTTMTAAADPETPEHLR